jgi:chorismate mutase
MKMGYAEQLNELRAEIDALDRTLLDAFEKRMDVAARGAALKRANGMAVLDAGRERQVVERAAALVAPELAEDAATLMRMLMALSRGYQARLLGEEN